MRELWIAFLLTLAGCVSVQMPSTTISPPPTPTNAPAATPKTTKPLVAQVSTNALAPRTYALVWDEQLNPSNQVRFEVWNSPDLTNWYLNQIVESNYCPIVTAFPKMFFRVRAVDQATGLASDWGTAAPLERR